MTIKSYVSLYELLKLKDKSREENRAFGLSHKANKDKPIKQLSSWISEHERALVKPTLADKFDSYLYGADMFLVVLAFILGLFSGMALLSYSGQEPVNIVYFMAMVILLPLLSIFFALISMLYSNTKRSVLVDLSPAFWMEKLTSFLSKKKKKELNSLKINPLLANWLVIKRSQMIALSLSFGLLFSLLMIVTGKDIAFAWSTTLSIAPETFHGFIQTLALPWSDFVPSAVPTMELVQNSQYFRLGDKLSEEMIANASKLGLWWKFLAMSTVFYAIILRTMMYIVSYFSFKKAIKKSMLSLDGVSKLLREMNEPIISTHAKSREEDFDSSQSDYNKIVTSLDSSYEIVHGWAMKKTQIGVLCDSMSIGASRLFEVGGKNSLREDSEIIAKSKGEILLFVKGWEPPTMDFVDYLEELCLQVDKVTIVPVGTAENAYSIKEAAFGVWERKLSMINEEKVCLKR